MSKTFGKIGDQHLKFELMDDQFNIADRRGRSHTDFSRLEIKNAPFSSSVISSFSSTCAINSCDWGCHYLHADAEYSHPRISPHDGALLVNTIKASSTLILTTLTSSGPPVNARALPRISLRVWKRQKVQSSINRVFPRKSCDSVKTLQPIIFHQGFQTNTSQKITS